MTTLESQRIEDFKKVLTYHVVSKIKYHFKSNYELYYLAPIVWKKWRNHSWRWSKDKSNTINPYAMICKFNDTALSRTQVQHIFGKDSDGRYLNYSDLIAQCNEIKTYNKGTLVVKDRRIGIKKRYELPKDYVESIFKDEQLLEAVLDAGSDFYSDRQRRIIFTQINKQKRYHYKTSKQISIEKESIDAERRAQEIVDSLDPDFFDNIVF